MIETTVPRLFITLTAAAAAVGGAVTQTIQPQPVLALDHHWLELGVGVVIAVIGYFIKNDIAGIRERFKGVDERLSVLASAKESNHADIQVIQEQIRKIETREDEMSRRLTQLTDEFHEPAFIRRKR